ncbi:MAG: hypothetical protein V7L23_13370 [Nostoc sp.]|uniref:hypothetical protein n=1 Tax=Nostoc sp. TaxID=1180 RepID=UPI002FF3ACF4
MEQPGVYKTEKLIPESQIEALVEKLVKKKLAEMLGVNTTTQPQRQWYDTEQAYSLLGLNLADQLRDMVRSGLLDLLQNSFCVMIEGFVLMLVTRNN